MSAQSSPFGRPLRPTDQSRIKATAELQYGTGDSWPDKYRPSCLAQMALSPDLRRCVEAYLEAPRLPHHLLLHGPPGVGKTTLAHVIARHFFPETWPSRVILYNAAEFRGIDPIRDSLITAIKARGGIFATNDPNWWELVVLSEADGLTPEAQGVLNDVMEDFAATAKFVFTTNHVEKLRPAIKSRCVVLEVGVPPLDERARVLAEVLHKEGLEADHHRIRSFAEKYEDMRELLRDAQTSFATCGELRLVTPNSPVELEPVDGARLLDALVEAFKRFVSLPEGAADALALWTVFAHAHDAFQVSPILTVTSPVKASGKTTLLTVLFGLVPNPLFTSSITPAGVFRGVQQLSPTLLQDEADGWMGLRPEIQCVLNSGHSRIAAYVVRCNRDGGVETFSTWSPKVIALIRNQPSDLPSTLADRSIIIAMLRPRPDAEPQPLRQDRIEEEFGDLRRRAATWASQHMHELRVADPAVQDLRGRVADNWRPLFAVADQAGGDWPDRARMSAKQLRSAAEEDHELRLQALADLRDIFDRADTDRIPSAVLVGKMLAMEDRPWPGWLNPIRLATLLRPFGVRPRDLWGECGDDGHGKRSMKGYFLKALLDLFERYLPARDDTEGAA